MEDAHHPHPTPQHFGTPSQFFLNIPDLMGTGGGLRLHTLWQWHNLGLFLITLVKYLPPPPSPE